MELAVYEALLARREGAVVLALPNSQTLVREWAAPRGILGHAMAAVAALVVFAIALELGNGQSVEFIYFEF